MEGGPGTLVLSPKARSSPRALKENSKLNQMKEFVRSSVRGASTPFFSPLFSLIVCLSPPPPPAAPLSPCAAMPVTADFAGRCSCCNNPWSRPSEGDLGYFAPACNACVADDAGVPGLDPANMDTSVSPGSNFFRHSNGVWMDSNPIPGEYPSWNTFTALHDKNLSRLKDMLETLPIPEKGSDAKSAAEKVAAFWGSAIDEESIEALGAQPLAPVLAVCDRAESDRTAAVAKLQVRRV